VVREFPLRSSRASALLVRPLAWSAPVASIGDEVIEVRVGALGRASIPLDAIARMGAMTWPWWAGIGVRISRGLVAYVPSSGPSALIGLREPIAVRAPFRWQTPRVAIGVLDVEAFLAEIASRRAGIARVDGVY
jgi:hypothetical protein